MKRLNVKTLVVCSFLIALNVILSRFIAIPGIINFGGFPIIFAGVVLGPFVGGLVGAVGDIVSFLLKPTGAFMPHFVLTSALTGIIPGLVMLQFKIERGQGPFWKILLAIFVGQLITSILMVPYFLHILFGLPWQVTVIKALSKQAINIPVYALLIKILAESLNRAKVLNDIG